MNNIVFLTIFCFVTFTKLVFANPIVHSGGGSLIGNGGDTIFCSPSSSNKFNGYFTLDYLLKFRNQEELAPWATDLTNTVRELKAHFQLHYPEILPLLNDFMDQVGRNHDSSSRRWIPSKTELSDIKDEDIFNQIPVNCLRENKNGGLEPNLVQTVIRQAFLDPIVYLYNEEVLTRQKKENPIQYSFFIMHEWLWDLTQDVEVIRKLNWLFHSPRIKEMSRRDLINLFDGLDVFQIKLSLCERSGLIKSQFPTACQQMKISDLRTITELNLTEIDKQLIFRVGDFYGFSKLKKLVIKSQNLSSQLIPRVFLPLYSLEYLELSDSHLNNISDEVLKDLMSLRVLNLKNSSIVSLPDSLRHLSKLETLFVSIDFGLFQNDLKQIEILPANLRTLVLQTRDTNLYRKVQGRILNLRPNLQLIQTP